MSELKDRRVRVFLGGLPAEELTPLYFKKTSRSKTLLPVPAAETLGELVLTILRMTQTYPSVFEDLKVQATKDRNRSALDLWRHVIAVRPEVQLSEVMHELFNLPKKSCGMLYCGTVKRRVFYPKFVDWFPEHNYTSTMPDEFGLTFYQWESE